MRALGATVEITGETVRIQGVGLGNLTAARRADRLPQRRHAHPPPLGPPRRTARPVRAHRGRVALHAPARARRRAAARDGRARRDDRRPRADRDRRRQPPPDPLRAPGRERAGEVGHPPRRDPGRRRPDHRRRAAARRATTPSACSRPPARASAAPRRAVSVWPAERLKPLDLDIPGDFSSAAPYIVAGHAPLGLRPAPARDRDQPDAHRAPQRARPHGRARLALQPSHRRRRAGRRHRGRARRADRDRHRGRRGAAPRRRAADLRAPRRRSPAGRAPCAAPPSCASRSPTGSRP